MLIHRKHARACVLAARSWLSTPVARVHAEHGSGQWGVQGLGRKRSTVQQCPQTGFDAVQPETADCATTGAIKLGPVDRVVA